MKLMLALFCWLAISQAAEVKLASRSPQKQPEEAKTEKRALDEGNAGVQKRAPINVSPTPGIEYAEDKSPQVAEKSPSQQIYATPAPQVAKISDVLSGHGVPFPTAIASHLFSPVSVYQPRLGSPTTYAVSQPIPSQLAYSEHKVYQPAQQNSVQYYAAGQKQAKGDQLARLLYNQPAPPQLFFQPQQILYNQQQTQSPQPQLFAQHLGQQAPQQLYTQQQTQTPQPQAIFQYQFRTAPVAYTQVQNQHPLQPLPYSATQGPVTFTQSQAQQPEYSQPANQPQLIQLLPQPIQYASQQQAPLNYQPLLQTHQNFQLPQAPQNYQQQPQALQNYQQSQQAPLIQVQQQHYQAQQQQPPVQRELKAEQSPARVLEKQTLAPQPNYNKQSGGAVSYASFSQSQPRPNALPQSSNNQLKDLKPQQQQIVYVKNHVAPPNYQQQPPYQQVYSQGQGILLQNPGFSVQDRGFPEQNQGFPVQNQGFPVQNQGFPVQNQGFPVQNPGFQGYDQQPLSATPTFAPVQYFGKFAQSIFGYPQQQ